MVFLTCPLVTFSLLRSSIFKTTVGYTARQVPLNCELGEFAPRAWVGLVHEKFKQPFSNCHQPETQKRMLVNSSPEI